MNAENIAICRIRSVTISSYGHLRKHVDGAKCQLDRYVKYIGGGGEVCGCAHIGVGKMYSSLHPKWVFWVGGPTPMLQYI